MAGGLVLTGILAFFFAPIGDGSVENAAWAQPKKKKKKPAKPQNPLPLETTSQPAPVTTTPAVSNLPLAALRLECSGDEKIVRLCDSMEAAAKRIASRKYQVVEQAKLEALFERQPSLRGCRRDECRAAIAEELGVTRLIDIILQSPKHHGLVANVSIFDSAAKGIAADTEVPLKREEPKLRRAIEEAVDLVITTQRLTAPLRLDIKPPGARVKLIDGRGGTRELTDAERDGTREVRVFLGPYTVRVEKPGFLPFDQLVTVAQAGASVAVQLKAQPVAVKFEWTPPEARVLVDGEDVDSRDKVIEVSEGSHKVEAIAPRGSPYESTVIQIDARIGMEPVRIALQRLTELRIKAPAGYSVSVDSQVIAAERLQVKGQAAETTLPTTPGPHTIAATSWRGYQISHKVEAAARTSTDANIRPPSLAPGAVLGTLGLLSTVAGIAVYVVGYSDASCTRPDCAYIFKPDLPGGLLMGLGGAAFIAGISWFSFSAANHPLFHRLPSSEKDKAGSAAHLELLPRRSPRLSVVPVLSRGFAGVQSELRF